MRAEFILITGANGTGKTMLIESNRLLLQREGFRIIIPDNILRHATSLTDSPALIQQHIDDAMSSGSNFVLESPFQFKSLVETLAKIKKAGYSMALYQYYLFDHSYFVDNATNQDMKLVAEFKKAVLIKFYSTQNPYLRKLFEQSVLQGKAGKDAFKIIKANRAYSTRIHGRRKSGRRLKF